MKNLSVRIKITIWFSLALMAVSVATFLLVMAASKTVLRGTIKNYLISAVEENVDKIRYVESEEDKENNYFIAYKKGFLEIDRDFVDVVNDVHMALYSADGTMLYGENPLSKNTGAIVFTESHTWQFKSNNVLYDLYDRKLNIELPDSEELWIRGIVPETRSAQQMSEILRISLIVLPLLIVFAVALGYILAGRMLYPLREIESTAKMISAGDDLKKRIETDNSNDELGRLARVFNRMLDRLDNSFEAERRFTSDASHELRTPAAVIIAQTEYSLEKERSVDEYIEALSVIHGQGQRMSVLIKDMLDYSRLSQGGERYPFEMTDLSSVVSETAKGLALLKEKGISLSAEISEGIKINGNAMLITRLVQNLISNAYRYGKENGHIYVRLKEDEAGDPVLSVEDDGIGIEASEQEKIFGRFYRADPSRSSQGTGLGLSIVKKITDLHGARIILDSKPGEGSTFTVIFTKQDSF